MSEVDDEGNGIETVNYHFGPAGSPAACSIRGIYSKFNDDKPKYWCIDSGNGSESFIHGTRTQWFIDNERSHIEYCIEKPPMVLYH